MPEPATNDAPGPMRLRVEWQAAVLTIWMCGFVVVLGAAWRRWARLRALLRSSRAVSLVGIDIGGLEVRVTRAPTEPGIFGFLRPVLVLPEGIVERLSHAQLDAIVRHERMHVMRRDNLTALPQMFVQALFWFHPLVWWLGAKLIAERERACDEAVLASGAEPRAYAGGIVAVCEAYVASPLRCAAGVGGGPLERRVADILARRKSRALGAAGKYALLAIGTAVLAAPILTGALAPRPASAQEAPPAGAALGFRRTPVDDDFRYLWAPLPGPPPLVTGYGSGGSDRHFNMSFSACALRDAAVVEDGDADVGTLPYIADFPALVRYAYGLERDALVWPPGARTPSLRSEQPFVRHSECRALLRQVLEEGYALEMHEQGGRFVVDRINVPAVPLSPWERGPLPPVELEPAVLDRYAGYFYGYPEAFQREFAPLFRLRRDGTSLVLEWSGSSFILRAHSATRFSTHRRYELNTDEPVVTLSFETDEAGALVAFVERSGSVPRMAARPIDAQSAEAFLSLIEEKIEHGASSPFAWALVKAIVARLDAADPASVPLADEAARALGQRIERWRPGALAGRGKLSSVLLLEVLPSGREIYEAYFDNLAIRFDVVLALDETVLGAGLDVACRMRQVSTSTLAPCIAPFYVGEDPRVAENPSWGFFDTLRLVTGSYSGGASGMLPNLSLAKCAMPRASGLGSTLMIRGTGDALSDVVRSAYRLEWDELVWEAESDPSVNFAVPDEAFDVDASNAVSRQVASTPSPPNVHRPLAYDCGAFVRRALSEELGLEAHFETRVLPAFELTRTVRDLRGLEPPTTAGSWVARESVVRLQGRNAEMGRLAAYLGQQFGVRVFDRTPASRATTTSQSTGFRPVQTLRITASATKRP